MSKKINKLRGRMGELGISIRQLSEKTGISHNGINYILAGKRTPTLSTFVTICMGLEIGANDIPEYLVNMYPELPFSYKGDENHAGNANNSASSRKT